MKRIAFALAVCCLVASACGSGSSPTSPSTPTPTPTTPAASLYTVTGSVSSAAGGTISNATVSIGDGPNSGKSAITDGAGHYSLSGLTFAGFTVNVSAPTFAGVSRGVPLTAGTLTTTANFTLLPSVVFSRSGSGDNVFDMPTYITRIHITGTFAKNSSNFIVKVGGRLLVNELLGTAWGQTVYDGTLVTSGGTVEITNSSGVAWTFTEQR